MDDKQFYFRVIKPTSEQLETVIEDGSLPADAIQDTWKVCLPHQCDDWEITTGFPFTDSNGGGWFWNFSEHQVAVSELEAFIAEAQEALEALKSRQELGNW